MARKMLFVMMVVLSVALVGCAAFGPVGTAEEPLEEQVIEGQVGEVAAENAGVEEEAFEAEPMVEEVAPSSGADTAEGVVEAPRDMGGGGEGAEAGGLGGGPDETVVDRGSSAEMTGDVPDWESQQLPALQAGETDDNEDFEDYLDYRRYYPDLSGAGPVNDVDVSERHVIHVTTPNGTPVLGARVRVYAGQSLVAEMRTPATGIVYFFPFADGTSALEGAFNVTVEKDGVETDFTLERGNPLGDEWSVELDVPPTQPPINLDVLFLLDATGSMSDEIEQLQDNILSISDQVDALPSQPNVRFGLVAYRDRGDQYITRVYDFTPDVREFQDALMQVRASGGDDYPESLNEGLHDAIWEPEWRIENTVSLIFLVADAPPHLDYANDYNYAEEMVEAARRGIKIHPIASSGLDVQGEYIYRQIAQYTGGHFIFLAYEETPQASGEPGTDHHIEEGSYSVEDLDNLVVRLIEEELANLSLGQQ
jgi:hypothetical protein